MKEVTVALSGAKVPSFGEQVRVPEKIELHGFTYYKISDAVLLSPGVHNSKYYPAESIAGAYQMTDWSDKRVRALYVDHKDNEVPAWVGFVDNVRFDGENLVGDLWITDDALAKKLALGAKFGISPKLSGTEVDGVIKNFVFDNFSIVVTPACKATYLNSEQKGDAKMDEENKKVEEQPVEEEKVEPENAEPQEVTEENNDAEEPKEEEKPEEQEEAPSEESKEESSEELSDEEIIKSFEELKSDYVEFVKDFLKKYPKATIADAAKAWKKKHSEDEENKEKKEKYPYPYPEEYKKKMDELEEKVNKINKIVSELSEKAESIEKKIEEPEIKSEPVSEPKEEPKQEENADKVILEALKQM